MEDAALHPPLDIEQTCRLANRFACKPANSQRIGCFAKLIKNSRDCVSPTADDAGLMVVAQMNVPRSSLRFGIQPWPWGYAFRFFFSPAQFITNLSSRNSRATRSSVTRGTFCTLAVAK